MFSFNIDYIRHAVHLKSVQLHRDEALHSPCQEYLTDDEYSELQWFLAAAPESGPVIPGAGGVRKLRWRAPGRGKRGGYRVIYCLKRLDGVIWMLTMYPKNVIEDIPANVLRQIREEIENG